MAIDVDHRIAVPQYLAVGDYDHRFRIIGIDARLEKQLAPYILLHCGKTKPVVSVVSHYELRIARAKDALAVENNDVVR
jgi:hypothetical protein